MATASLNLVLQVTDRASKQINDFGKNLSDRFEGVATRARMMGLEIGAAGAAIGVALGKTVNDASNLGESINAVNVVFGKASDRLNEFAQTASQSAGLSQRAFNEAVVPIGSMLQNMGQSADQAATASINLAQRAADMASVFNTDLGDALGAIQAGLRGEADPLERFGVTLSQTAVEAYALEKGLIRSGQQMDAQTTITARLGLFMAQTNKVAGDFANTSDSFANQQRILNAELENTSARLGQALKPTIEAVQKALLPIVTKIGEWVEKNPKLTETIVKIVAVLGVLATVVGTLLLALGPLSTAFTIFMTVLGVIISPVGLVIAVLAALGAGIFLLVKHFDTLKAKVADVWGSIVEYFTPVIDRVKGVIEYFRQLVQEGDYMNDNLQFLPKILQDIVLWFHTTKQAIQDFVEGVKTFFSDMFTKGLEIVTAGLTAIGNAFMTYINFWIGLLDFFAETFLGMGLKDLFAKAQEMFSAFGEWVSNMWQMLWDGLSWAFEAFKTYIMETLILPFIEDFKIAWTAMSEGVKFIWNGLLGLAKTIWEAIRKFISDKINNVKTDLEVTGNAITKLWEAIWNGLATKFTDIYTNAIKPAIEKAVSWITSAWDKVKGIIDSIGGGIKSIASFIGEGVSNLVSRGESVTGSRAVGGSVAAGGMYRVGERGPEYFVPSTNGTIIPNGGMGSAPGISVVITGNSISDRMDLDEIATRVGDEIVRKLKLAYNV